MSKTPKRPLKVFLSYASEDHLQVQKLYRRLKKDGVDPWQDQENLLPGQNWKEAIDKALDETDAIIVCLSQKAVNKEGFIQKEIRRALDLADEKPEGTIYIIPARIEDVDVPKRLSFWQWVDLDLSDKNDFGYELLMKSLKLRAKKLGVVIGDANPDPTTFPEELQRLYYDGLEAYHVEKWDRAIYYFRAFLAESPNHTDAREKLAESEKQQYLETLYIDAVKAQNKEMWQVAIQGFEKLARESKNYKDTAVRLEEVKKAHRVAELYKEANLLYKAEAWEGVIKIFSKIEKINPNFSDSEKILPHAEDEFSSLIEQRALETLYTEALKNKDAGKLKKAKSLFKQVQKKSPNFRETNTLLKKVNDEIRIKKKPIAVKFTIKKEWGGILAILILAFGFFSVLQAVFPSINYPWGKPTNTPTPTPTPLPTKTATPTQVSVSFSRLFYEDFEDGKADRFTNWPTNTSFYVDEDETGNKVFVGNKADTNEYPFASFGSTTWRNYSINYRVRFLEYSTDSQATVYFRLNYPMDDTAYHMELAPSQRVARLAYWDGSNGTWSEMSTKNYAFRSNQWYSVRIEVLDENFKLFIDDTLVIDDTDTRLKHGPIALMYGPHTHVQFDDIEVTELEK